MDIEDIIKSATELMSQGELDQAQALIGNGIESFPESAELQFLFAAVNAQNQAYDTAIKSYQIALNLNPTMHIARFQLGLLLATLEQGQQSIDVLNPLTSIGRHYLSEFAKGVIALLENQLSLAQSCLAEGLTLNQENASLNADMQAMLTRVENAILEENTSQATAPDIEQEPQQADAEHTDNTHLLDIYQNKH